MISLEESGTLSKMQRLQKKVLQEAYDHALKKKIVSVLAAHIMHAGRQPDGLATTCMDEKIVINC